MPCVVCTSVLFACVFLRVLVWFCRVLLQFFVSRFLGVFVCFCFLLIGWLVCWFWAVLHRPIPDLHGG